MALAVKSTLCAIRSVKVIIIIIICHFFGRFYSFLFFFFKLVGTRSFINIIYIIPFECNNKNLKFPFFFLILRIYVQCSRPIREYTIIKNKSMYIFLRTMSERYCLFGQFTCISNYYIHFFAL